MSSRHPNRKAAPLAKHRPRRAPVQDRSRGAVARMLSAAAELFAERGFEATTTDAIAARAGLSVGSVYRFFPNKASIVHALVDQHVAQIDKFFRALEEEEERADARPSPEEQLHRAIDLFASHLASDPSFRALWTSGHSYREIVAVGYQLTQWAASRVARLIGPYVTLEGAKLERVSLVVSEATFAVLAMTAHDARPEFAAGLVEEVKRLVTGYLLPYLR